MRNSLISLPMKTACLSIAFVSAILASTGAAVEHTVGSCADLADVDDTTITSLTITTSPFECDEYLRFRVRNSMTLEATVPEVVFSNLSLKVLGNLTVDADVTFSDVLEQVSQLLLEGQICRSI